MAKGPRLGAEGNPGPQCRRKLYTGGDAWTWSHGHRRVMVSPWRAITGAEPGAVKAASPVLNGGDEEACCNAPCPYPTASLPLSAAPDA
jgi:hypothetical protein